MHAFQVSFNKPDAMIVWSVTIAFTFTRIGILILNVKLWISFTIAKQVTLYNV